MTARQYVDRYKASLANGNGPNGHAAKSDAKASEMDTANV